jgi:hypothetical protein
MSASFGNFSTKVATGAARHEEANIPRIGCNVRDDRRALAADLPVYGPRPAPFIVQQAVEWTGFYFGANAGYGWGQQSSDIRFTGNNGVLTNLGCGTDN